MRFRFSTFLGVDLGGGKGKTTAVARLRREGSGVVVLEVGNQNDHGQLWHDEALVAHLGEHADSAVLAIDAPMTLTACVRCVAPVCPGVSRCVDPAVAWFRTSGQELADRAAAAATERDQIAAVPAGRSHRPRPATTKPVVTPYTQRATELVMHKGHGIIPRETLGQGMGPLTARAAHLRRALVAHGFRLNENLLEVYPKATITKLWGAEAAHTYKRRAGTWEVRARVLESLAGTLRFAATSKLAREQVLQSDHCFDAVISAYTAYLWATDGWQLPTEHREVFEVDGWIWAPP